MERCPSLARRACITVLLAAILCGCSGPNAQIARCQSEKQELLAVIEQEKLRTTEFQERALALETRLDQSEKQLASLVRPGSRFVDDDETRTASSKPSRPLDPPQRNTGDPVREPARQSPGNPRTTLREMKLQAPDVGNGSRLADLALRDPRVQYDAHQGTARLALDVRFEEGSAELTAAARQKLDEAAAWLKSPQTADLRVLVAAASSAMTKPAAGAEGPRYSSDRQLAAARAMAVADYLDSHGIQDDRLAVVGGGSRGPSTLAVSAGGVEILLSEPDTAVAGVWSADTKRR